MDLRILDIRIGRANRVQLWCTFLALLIINLISYFTVHQLSFLLLISIPSVYLFMLVAVRRARDLNLADDSLIETLPDTKDKHNFLMSIFFFLHFKEERWLYFDPYLFLWIFSVKGDPVKNDYGYPPCGLNFLSMIATDYSKKQKDEAANAKKAQYKNKTKTHQVEAVEFTGREIK